MAEYPPRVFGKVFSNNLARSGSFIRLPRLWITSSWNDVSRAKDVANLRLTSTAELVKVLHEGSGRMYGKLSGPPDGIP